MSSSDRAIVVRNLSKLYRRRTVRSTTLSEAILSRLGASRRTGAAAARETWALDGVSFEVKRGEVVGIVGRNGAGKTTLLKILSRITWPTTGEAEVSGRVSSLLEIGAGFHTELTGRENVFLNGAILGMRRAEVRARFDDIVSFAEVETFIDTPVKHYSMGMFMRLAFSVAAHLEPEILIIDEVLAVGDAAFQRKSMGQMQRLAKSDRTVLIVSHNLSAIRHLCSRALLLDAGRLAMDGRPEQVIDAYIGAMMSGGGERVWDAAAAPGSERVRMRAIRILCEGRPAADVEINKGICIQTEYDSILPGHQLFTSLLIQDSLGTEVFETFNRRTTGESGPSVPGRYRSECHIPGNLLNAGRVIVSVRVGSLTPPLPEAIVDQAVSFTIVDTGSAEFFGRGVVRPVLEWKTSLLDGDAPVGADRTTAAGS